MEREECEAKITEMMTEIWNTYKEYNPDGNYIDISVNDGFMHGNNCYYKENSKDSEKPIDFAQKL